MMRQSSKKFFWWFVKQRIFLNKYFVKYLRFKWAARYPKLISIPPQNLACPTETFPEPPNLMNSGYPYHKNLLNHSSSTSICSYKLVMSTINRKLRHNSSVSPRVNVQSLAASSPYWCSICQEYSVLVSVALCGCIYFCRVHFSYYVGTIALGVIVPTLSITRLLARVGTAECLSFVARPSATSSFCVRSNGCVNQRSDLVGIVVVGHSAATVTVTATPPTAVLSYASADHDSNTEIHVDACGNID